MKKPTLLSLCWLSLTVFGLHAQGYESQYPYDPYNPTPQATPKSYSSYQTYESGGDYGGAYSAQSHGNILSYGYLSGHYAYNDFRGDDKLEGSSGFGVDLGVELMKPLFLHFGLDRLTSETPNAKDIEVTSLSAAGGVYLPFASRFHAFGELGVRYDFVDGDYDLVYTDDFSVFARAGLRFAVTDRLELAGSLLFNNTDNFNEFAVEVDAFFAVLSWFDLNVGVDFGDDVNSYQVGGRVRW